jgi:DNA helicase IV
MAALQLRSHHGEAGVSAPSPQHPEFESEQAFLRHAYECLKDMQARREARGDSGGDPKASAALEKLRQEVLERLGDPDSLCFGRIDLVEGNQHYVGRQGIWENGYGSEPIVINWRAAAAEPFYTATPADHAGLTLRRRFRTDGSLLLGIADEPFGVAPTAEPTIGDILLEELGRERTAEMRDIVATIQDDQYRIISRPIDSATVVQGGPGTGKTAVGLHRAAMLLYRHREALTASRVLIVGPNPLFMQYIRYVLPALGETAADQSAIGGLGSMSSSRTDEVLVARVKGDERMSAVLRRAVADRVRAPSDDVTFRANGVDFRVKAEVITDLIGDFDAESTAYQVARDRFRAALERQVLEAYTSAAYERRPGRPVIPVNARSLPEFDRALDRIWPAITAQEIVRQLLASDERLDRAGTGVLSSTERRLIYRKPVEKLEEVQWTISDVPLVDEVQELLDRRPRRYGHVVLDEAQDLTPMQLRMVGRRIRDGSATILGDLAQATGLWKYASWSEITDHLGLTAVADLEELTLAYRVPREIMDVALPVLEITAPSIHPPIAFRDGGDEATWIEASREGRAGQAVDRAVAAHAAGGTAAILAPANLLPEIRAELERRNVVFGDAEAGELAGSVELLTPAAAKGLEFDHVLLLEPAAIVREASDGQDLGYRELYVALTRATRSLACVHAEPLPWPLGSLRQIPEERPAREIELLSPEAGATVGPSAPAISLGEALVLAQVRGLDLSGALARALIAQVRGASEVELAAAVLDPGLDVPDTELVAYARRISSGSV